MSQGLDFETFEIHETIIIKSCAGAGKTSAIAPHIETDNLLKDADGEPDANFLIVATRPSLSDQCEQSFTNLKLKSYQDLKTSIHDSESFVIWLNSLVEFAALDEEDIAKYAMYVNEVLSFTEFADHPKHIDDFEGGFRPS